MDGIGNFGKLAQLKFGYQQHSQTLKNKSQYIENTSVLGVEKAITFLPTVRVGC